MLGKDREEPVITANILFLEENGKYTKAHYNILYNKFTLIVCSLD